MTTIGLTAYYAPSARYGGSEKAASKADDAYADPSPPQEMRGTNSKDPESVVDSRPSLATVNLQGKLIASSLEGTPVWEMPEDFYQRIISGREMLLEAQYRQFPEPSDLSQYGGTQSYAEIVIAGRVVATIDNQGVVGTSGEKLGERLRGLSEDAVGRSGPELAQDLAEQIAKLLGGQIVKSDTALTQSEFDALPQPENPQPWIDYDAMRADPEYAQVQDMKRKREEYLAFQQADGA